MGPHFYGKRIHRQDEVSQSIPQMDNTGTNSNELLNELVKEGTVVIQNATNISDVSSDHLSVNCNQVIKPSPMQEFGMKPLMQEPPEPPEPPEPMGNLLDLIPSMEYPSTSLW